MGSSQCLLRSPPGFSWSRSRWCLSRRFAIWTQPRNPKLPRISLLSSSVNKPCATSGRRAGGVLGGPLQSVVGDLLPAVLPDGVMRAPRELPVVGDGLGVAVVLNV